MGGARHPVPDQLPRFDPAFSPANSADDPHLLRAIGRAWIWRRRMEAGEFAKVHDLAKAVGLAERHVSGMSVAGSDWPICRPPSSNA